MYTGSSTASAVAVETWSLCAPLRSTDARPVALPPSGSPAAPVLVWVTPFRPVAACPTRTGAPEAVPLGTGRDSMSASRNTSFVAMGQASFLLSVRLRPHGLVVGRDSV